MPDCRFDTLGEWLAWQETFHHSEIDLGLERVRAVADKLLNRPPLYPVITVAGTNGKGSVLAYLQAILNAAGYRTGLFTSPHLVRYNERIAVNGEFASDAELIQAFAAVDGARADTSLTYFEFSALAALHIFESAEVDVGLLEIGMGGRLDAVNIVDPDVAVITNIGLDHQSWLGHDREAIGREKAGVMRSRRPVVCGDPDPPATLLAHAKEIGAELQCVNRDFRYLKQASAWTFQGRAARLENLPLPSLQGDVQVANAALALAALQCLGDRLPVAVGHAQKGLASAVLPGRIQQLGRAPLWVLDVCHNGESARVLANWLATHPCRGRTRLVLGMLRDKNVQAVVDALSAQVEEWYLAGLSGARGLPSEALAERVGPGARRVVGAFASVEEACARAAREAGQDDRIVVCGSFHTVGAALALEL